MTKPDTQYLRTYGSLFRKLLRADVALDSWWEEFPATDIGVKATDAEFKEEEHPRDEDGKFSEDGGEYFLLKLGTAAKKEDKEEFEKVRADFYKAIDSANISDGLKRDLKASIKEISYVTPKFTMGVLAGEISKISRESDKAVVDINYSEFDAFLQKYFDMGQKQIKKLLNDYGYTDFSSATEYDLGGIVMIRVHGFQPKIATAEESKKP